ncbi:TPA: alkaline phosphatase D family protein [Photobacterium damselae]
MKRRSFIKAALIGSSATLTAQKAFALNSPSNNPSQSLVHGHFTHGVASGDPTQHNVIIWTRYLPFDIQQNPTVVVCWQCAKDRSFKHIIKSGEVTTSAERDFTLKVDVTGLKSNHKYFYRFKSGYITSDIGEMHTLPSGYVKHASLAVATCANYPAGHFHVYKEILKQHEEKPFTALIHLGDYIYEYGMGQYATEHSIELDRVPSPAHECRTLTDYRRRYAQYRSDPDLLALHKKLAFICTWDDHEIADNAYQTGALDEPNAQYYQQRRDAALQAFHEWLPIRDGMVKKGEVYRSFKIGNLIHLIMMDTRVTGRTKQLDYMDYDLSSPAIAYKQLQADLYNPKHQLLGKPQKDWLYQELTHQNARWTILGQQVLMTKMDVPFNLLAALLKAKQAHLTRTPFDHNQVLTAAQQPSILMAPYNLDAWDGYPADRDWLYLLGNQLGKSFISLAGDTHNAWSGELITKTGSNIGVEFASTSITSPGMESYLPLPHRLLRELQGLFPALVKDLKWANIVDRGFMRLDCDYDEVECKWYFVSDILKPKYTILSTTETSTEDALYLSDFDTENYQSETESEDKNDYDDELIEHYGDSDD